MSEFHTTATIPNFKGDVMTAVHPEYLKAISRWAANAARKAKVVAFVKDAQDVVQALQYAKANGLPIAVRGGGHNPYGASSVEGGLVIDLSRHMNKVRVDPAKKLAYVGGGTVWETVDKESIKHGLATVAGTVNHTGVGGLALGGGYGWLSSAHGLVIDNILQATLVTASGSILTVNKTENADLYFAIRGGGGNFGVVTEFVLQLYPQRQTVYAGTVVYPASQIVTENLAEATEEWRQGMGERECMMQLATFGPDGKPIIVMFPFYNGTKAEGRERFKKLLDVGPMSDTSREMPYEEINSLLNPTMTPGQGAYMKGLAVKHLHAPSMLRAHERLSEIMSNSPFKIGGILYEFFGKKTKFTGAEEAAFRREKAVDNALIFLSWDQDSATKGMEDEARRVAAELVAMVIQNQPGLTPVEALGYGNHNPDAVDIDRKGVDKVRMMFGANYPRLQELKQRYDPDGVFNKWFPITPASSA
ncbi:hypothetical protein NLJ89_g6435 [Agrocybe chaxingu]|uniref:FAD-binding PCMH-type domain-containing protein n=1 Tax=Agrocybe chaxingu TaxID=84603 RepID=A0A9W8JYM6_9AGAR|nr:hypothetical protein NLJ89_g6435 [Agrocybe chaxingu]